MPDEMLPSRSSSCSRTESFSYPTTDTEPVPDTWSTTTQYWELTLYAPSTVLSPMIVPTLCFFFSAKVPREATGKKLTVWRRPCAPKRVLDAFTDVHQRARGGSPARLFHRVGDGLLEPHRPALAPRLLPRLLAHL